ncbi:MAG TPA: hypothetical protein VGK67_30165 [Myxococcales bacterium]
MRSDAAATPGPDAAGGPTDAAAAQHADAASSADAAALAGSDAATPGLDAAEPGPDAGPAWTEVRGLVHMHSAYSHDGCDSQGFDDAGVLNRSCVDELRAMPCDNHLSFVALTDHPSNMKEHTLLEDLLYQAGDQLALDGQGEPIGNLITCPDGHQVLFMVGFEGTHTAPLGLHRVPQDPALFGSLVDSAPLAENQATVQGLKDLGAVAAIVHSEEPDLSAQRLLDSGVEAMEWYNVHASILALTGSDQIGGEALAVLDLLKSFEPFLLGSKSGANPDLLFLSILPNMPAGGFDKWNQVQLTRRVSGMLGSDIHRNVSVDPVCSGAWKYVCQGAAALYPNTLTLLVNGGPVVLSDGDRLDSYGRIGRWLENRLQVTSLTPEGFAEALRAGRNYGLFAVFGGAEGFAFTARSYAKTIAMGGSGAGPLELRVQVPARPVQLDGAAFTAAQADRAQIKVRIIRGEASGPVVVRETTQPGELVSGTVSVPGPYHVEIWIRPLHLTQALGSETQLADHDFLWVVSNPIWLEP